jgi:hypothetical protein
MPIILGIQVNFFLLFVLTNFISLRHLQQFVWSGGHPVRKRQPVYQFLEDRVGVENPEEAQAPTA